MNYDGNYDFGLKNEKKLNSIIDHGKISSLDKMLNNVDLIQS